MRNYNEQYVEQIERLKKENIQLKKENNNLKNAINCPANPGEQITLDHLISILKNLKYEKKITNYKIYNNLSLGAPKETHYRQVDHLVITNRGIFVIETKHWKGDIYYNFSSEDLEKFKLSGLKKYLYDSKTKTYKTFILDSANYNLVFRSYGHPYDQIMATTLAIKEKFNFPFVNPIIYFNYQSSYNVFKGNNEKYVSYATSKQELSDVLEDKMFKNNKFNRYYTDNDILQICKEIETSFK
ncbi:nuclease-related domain-containing protein [Staphylococcus hominis]|uniref:nuclease-related domain-containing protein n=1 Tax=Staphylococcus hominis TaxID=1290 RepID=UPI001BD37B2A|nr:nuclease-related domain-containing protein [Staphylococcus hominis]MBS9538799.1 NERD domain-containing protein [Staphylococcus hominis subsp. novobiosepticus]